MHNLSEHPIRRYFDKGVVVTLNTDNTTVSGITLSEEYYLIHKELGFSVEEIVQIIDNGFRSSFVRNPKLKTRLRAEALYTCFQILHSEGFDIGGMVENTAHLSPGLVFPISLLTQNPPLPTHSNSLTPATPNENKILSVQHVKSRIKENLHHVLASFGIKPRFLPFFHT